MRVTGTVRSALPVIAVLVASVVVVPSMASADHVDFEESRIVVGAAVAPLSDPCTPSQITPGATVYELPDGVGDGEHSFRILNTDLLATMPWFFHETSDGCETLGNGGAPMGFFGITEAGIVPEGAEYIQIRHFFGAGQFTLQIPNPACTDAPGC